MSNNERIRKEKTKAQKKGEKIKPAVMEQRIIRIK